ncbi:hypothetical protein XFF6992_210077 [Xanthomonas citri pv. fuscans]|nr:hypothetical protein XFF6992_210077 [Xanthomonas citri pv. fuscans]
MQVRPCKLRGGIHAAKGPATVGRQGPIGMIGVLVQATGNVRWLYDLDATRLQRPGGKPHRLRTMSCHALDQRRWTFQTRTDEVMPSPAAPARGGLSHRMDRPQRGL